MNSGSFEQITTSWLIEKTEDLINWKFTHITQRSQYNWLPASIPHTKSFVTRGRAGITTDTCHLYQMVARCGTAKRAFSGQANRPQNSARLHPDGPPCHCLTIRAGRLSECSQHRCWSFS